MLWLKRLGMGTVQDISTSKISLSEFFGIKSSQTKEMLILTHRGCIDQPGHRKLFQLFYRNEKTLWHPRNDDPPFSSARNEMERSCDSVSVPLAL